MPRFPKNQSANAVTSLFKITSATGGVGAPEGGNAIKTGAGVLLGLHFMSVSAGGLFGRVLVYDALTATGTAKAVFYCPPRALGGVQTIYCEIPFSTGLSVLGVNLAEDSPYNTLTIQYE